MIGLALKMRMEIVADSRWVKWVSIRIKQGESNVKKLLQLNRAKLKISSRFSKLLK